MSLVMADIRLLFTRVLQREEVYLANHSLGRPLDRTEQDVLEGLRVWYEDMDGAWELWSAERLRFGNLVRKIIGWEADGGVVPKASCGQGLRAILNALPGKPVVVASRNEFDSVDFILKAYRDAGKIDLRWVEASEVSPEGIPLYCFADYQSALEGASLVVVSAVYFESGWVFQGLQELKAACKKEGALLAVDLYHAAGVLPVDLAGADFALGGCYKYLRGGPGACFLAVSPEVTSEGKLRTTDTGWYAKPAPFSYERAENAVYANGEAAWLESTPAVLPLFQARAGLEFTADIGVETMREEMLTMREKLAHHLPIMKVGDPTQWGQFALMKHPNAAAFCQELKKLGVNVDSRNGFVRFGPDILTTDEDLDRAGQAVAQLSSVPSA